MLAKLTKKYETIDNKAFIPAESAMKTAMHQSCNVMY